MKPSFQAREVSERALHCERSPCHPTASTQLQRIRSVMGVHYLNRAISTINNLIYLLQSWRDNLQLLVEERANIAKIVTRRAYPKHPRWHSPGEWSPLRLDSKGRFLWGIEDHLMFYDLMRRGVKKSSQVLDHATVLAVPQHETLSSRA